jgi:16S rRNA processing protein RimM
MSKDQICVGVVTGAFGVRGEVRLKSFCAEPSAIADYSPLTDEAGNIYKISLSRPVKGGFGARLGGISNKDQADAIKGLKLYANRDDLPSLPDDEYYYTDLIGLEVFDTGGEKIGKINAVHNHGAGDLLELSGAAIDGSTLVPFTAEIVPTVDLKTRRVIVDAPAGLLG